ncbi:MAG TPA: hypothetical protein VED59_02230, partial [Acidimicrobiales bacterium]|nr:hypothetical protein [Acidimicrobiales bacterium]
MTADEQRTASAPRLGSPQPLQLSAGYWQRLHPLTPVVSAARIAVVLIAVAIEASARQRASGGGGGGITLVVDLCL